MTERADYKIIQDIVEPNSKVLDLGCGNGDLLYLLTQKRNIKGQGIELDDSCIHQCVEKDLSVFHSDIDSGLPEYPDNAFDYVILNQSLQEVKKADLVLKEALRVGNKVIISFPNFAYLKLRCDLFFKGKAPLGPYNHYEWHNTPNINYLSIKDFREYCNKKGIKILNVSYIANNKRRVFLPNLLATVGIFVIQS